MPTHKDLPPPTQFSVDNREAWQGERYKSQKENGKMDSSGPERLVKCLAGWTAIALAIILALAGQYVLVALAVCLALWLFFGAGEKQETL
jgi:hypothetical protein